MCNMLMLGGQQQLIAEHLVSLALGKGGYFMVLFDWRILKLPCALLTNQKSHPMCKLLVFSRASMCLYNV